LAVSWVALRERRYRKPRALKPNEHNGTRQRSIGRSMGTNALNGHRASAKRGKNAKDDPAGDDASALSKQSKDPTGQAGTKLDLTG
jgi:hypothetical protein